MLEKSSDVNSDSRQLDMNEIFKGEHMTKTRRKFTRDFKINILTKLNSGKSLAQLARENKSSIETFS